jgi:hypothetical protein
LQELRLNIRGYKKGGLHGLGNIRLGFYRYMCEGLRVIVMG